MGSILEAMENGSVAILQVTTAWAAAELPTYYATMFVGKRYLSRTFAVLFSTGSGEMYFGSHDGGAGTWSGWKSVATATPPTEYDLPLASGVTGTAKYGKDQFGRIILSLYLTASISTSGLQLGTLPTGYRPSGEVHFLGAAKWTEGAFAHCWINTQGQVFAAASSTATGIYAVESFVAAP